MDLKIGDTFESLLHGPCVDRIFPSLCLLITFLATSDRMEKADWLKKSQIGRFTVFLRQASCVQNKPDAQSSTNRKMLAASEEPAASDPIIGFLALSVVGNDEEKGLERGLLIRSHRGQGINNNQPSRMSETTKRSEVYFKTMFFGGCSLGGGAEMQSVG